MQDIKSYSGYSFDENLVLRRLSDGKPQRLFGTRYKVKADDGSWNWKSRNNLLAAQGLYLKLPETARRIKGTDYYYLDTDGNVYSYSPANKAGRVLERFVASSGYWAVSLTYSDRVKRAVDIHRLLAETFIMEDYVERGLCCMHKDNNKLNFTLSNLAIGTYSENNKQAYADGINPGNGLKKLPTPSKSLLSSGQ